MKLTLKPWVGNPSAAAAGCPATSSAALPSGAALGAGQCLEVAVGPRSWSVCLAAEAGGIAEAQQLSQPDVQAPIRCWEMGRVQENGRKLGSHRRNALALPITGHLPW